MDARRDAQARVILAKRRNDADALSRGNPEGRVDSGASLCRSPLAVLAQRRVRFAGCIPNRPRRRCEINANRPYFGLRRGRGCFHPERTERLNPFVFADGKRKIDSLCLHRFGAPWRFSEQGADENGFDSAPCRVEYRNYCEPNFFDFIRSAVSRRMGMGQSCRAPAYRVSL